MSFSSQIKEDLTRLRLRSEAQKRAELAGLAQGCGALYLGRVGKGAAFTSESLPVGKRIAALAGALYALDVSMELSRQQRRKSPLVTVTLTGADAEKLLLDTGLLRSAPDGVTLGEGLPGGLDGNEELTRCFLRGLFLGGGSCMNPGRGYHLELVVRAEGLCEQVAALIRSFGVAARRRKRREAYVVYCKGEDVSGFLALIGASGGALAFESVRAEREFRNYVNRKSNCETANIGKTVDAALAQTRAIELIERTMDLSRLPAPLYEAAMLRLGHPDATLQELADLAEIGKSGMNHRLTRLIRMAEEIEHG